jgi:hypothetical protein
LYWESGGRKGSLCLLAGTGGAGRDGVSEPNAPDWGSGAPLEALRKPDMVARVRQRQAEKLRWWTVMKQKRWSGCERSCFENAGWRVWTKGRAQVEALCRAHARYRSEILELGSRLTLSEPRASSLCQLERWDAMKGWRGSAAKSRELGRGCRCPPNTGRGTFEIRAAVVPGVGCGSNRGRGVE